MISYSAKQLQLPSHKAVLDDILTVLTKSFAEDANAKWILGAGSNRIPFTDSLPVYMRLLVRLALASDAFFIVMTKEDCASPTPNLSDKMINTVTLYQDSSNIRAVCILIPPHGNKIYDSVWTHLRVGMLMLPFKVGLRSTHRLLVHFVPEMNRMHDEMFPDPALKHRNWHLFILAAHPENRGQGLGKKLLLEAQNIVQKSNEVEKKLAEHFGKDFIPCPIYLEASNFNNRRLYERVGFEVRADLVYGELDDHENLNIRPDGIVDGGRMFGMVWNP